MQQNRSIDPDRIAAQFVDVHGSPPDLIARSPGRVNLIGDHTDYNDGLALPMAIPQSVFVAARQRDDGIVNVMSSLDSSHVRFPVSSPDRKRDGWSAYLGGVTSVLAEAGVALSGWDGVISSDLPVGAGLSSSAALELAVARTYTELGDTDWDPAMMARLCQRAENEWVGVSSGLLDQFSSALGREGTAMVIDFATLEVTHIPVPASAAVLVLDTGTRRELVDSDYNLRREECDEISETLGLVTLRDLEDGHLDALRTTLARRARHLIRENRAVEGVAEAFRARELEAAGELFAASHRSLRDDYEVSSVELDAMVSAVSAIEGVYGARMTGGGFGGSVVALAEDNAVEAVTELALSRYLTATGITGSAMVVQPVGGTSVVWCI